MAEPQHYTCSLTTQTRRWWAEPQSRNWPITVSLSKCTPTWSSLDFSGRSAARIKWEALGTRQVQVTNPRIRQVYSSSPAYVPATLDGGTWWVALGQTVTLPRQICTILSDAGYTVTTV